MGVTLLLDTHVLVWAQARPQRLSPTAREAIEDPENVVLVSAVSAFELAMKHRLGKLPEAAPMVSRWTHYVDLLGGGELEVRSDHAVLAGSMSWEHRDPFDRLLVAQAVLEDATLVTNDRAITSGSTARVVW